MFGKSTVFARLLQSLKIQAEMDPFNQKYLAVLIDVDGPLLACKAALTSIQSRLDQAMAHHNTQRTPCLLMLFRSPVWLHTA